MQRIWSVVDTLTSSALRKRLRSAVQRMLGRLEALIHKMQRALEGGSSPPEEKDLRARMNERVETKRQKKNDLEQIKKQIEGLQSATGTLRGSLGQLQRRLGEAKETQAQIQTQQEELIEQMRRATEAIAQKRADLEEIGEIKEDLQEASGPRWKTILIAVIVGALVGTILAKTLWSLGGWIV